MTDKPIPFTRAMALATWRGDKTETRRVLNPQPDIWRNTDGEFGQVTGWLWRDCSGPVCTVSGKPVCVNRPLKDLPLPYATGDRLWVREPYWQRGHWAPIPGETTKGGAEKWQFLPSLHERHGPRFDPPRSYRLGMRRDGTAGQVDWYQRLARFMPRQYSRQTLVVRDVGVERLHDIDEAGALAEGVKRNHYQHAHPFIVETDFLGAVAFGETARDAYRDLWTSINGRESWDANPWVVVVRYAKLDADK